MSRPVPASDPGRSEYEDHLGYYYNQVDLFGALGLGPNVPVLNGTGSDSLSAFDPTTRQFITMRVPYPLGFYTRGMDFRIDDPNAGWKGRGAWAANNNRVVWHTEGGKGMPKEPHSGPMPRTAGGRRSAVECLPHVV